MLQSRLFLFFHRVPTRALLALAGLLLACNATGAAGLSILLTNDDGYDSAGIRALESALRAAGHRVTIVAPAGQRSGSGMQITLGRFALSERRRGVWSVDASPADSVSVGLRHVMRAAPPDLVVSGANFGQNLGHNAMMSGTVGAAMMAVLNGVPAIAVSVGIRLEEATAEPQHFPSTIAAFPAAAALTVRVIDQLLESGGGLLPDGTMLNINYPARAASAIGGLRWAPLSRHGGFDLIYPELVEGQIRSWIEPSNSGRSDSSADTGLFAAGYVTLSVLRPDWNADAAAASVLRERLGALDLR